MDDLTVEQMTQNMKRFEGCKYIVVIYQNDCKIGRILARYGNGAVVRLLEGNQTEFIDYIYLHRIVNENVIISTKLDQ